MARDIGAPFPVSELAEPPIGIDEAAAAAPSVCRVHGGLVGDHWSVDDFLGRVMYCNVGRMYWRLSARVVGMHRPLRFPRNL